LCSYAGSAGILSDLNKKSTKILKITDRGLFRLSARGESDQFNLVSAISNAGGNVRYGQAGSRQLPNVQTFPTRSIELLHQKQRAKWDVMPTAPDHRQPPATAVGLTGVP
jgi:hypothetical protein